MDIRVENVPRKFFEEYPLGDQSKGESISTNTCCRPTKTMQQVIIISQLGVFREI